MTAQILKSHIQDEGAFRAAIERHIAQKIKALDGAGPMPAEPFLDQFIKRTPQGDPNPDLFEVDYEVIDDTPTPAEARAKAIADLRRQEADEIEKILPAHKRRLFELDSQRLYQRISDDAMEGKPAADEDEKEAAEIRAINAAIAEIQYAYAKREAEL